MGIQITSFTESTFRDILDKIVAAALGEKPQPPITFKVKPSIATTVGLYPQTRTILRHLEKRGSIGPMEALMAYGCTRLAARIHELREAGFVIDTTIRTDAAGHRYARYKLVPVNTAQKAA